MTDNESHAMTLRSLATRLYKAKIIEADNSNLASVRDLFQYATETAIALENGTNDYDMEDFNLVTECIWEELAKV